MWLGILTMNIAVIHKIVRVKCCKMAALTKTRNTRHTRTLQRNKTNKKSNWQGLGVGLSLFHSISCRVLRVLEGIPGSSGVPGF